MKWRRTAAAVLTAVLAAAWAGCSSAEFASDEPVPMSLVELIARFNDSGGIRYVEVSGYCSAAGGALALYLSPADADNGLHKNSVRLELPGPPAPDSAACAGRFVTVTGRYARGSRFDPWSGVLEDVVLEGVAPPPPTITEDSIP